MVLERHVREFFGVVLDLARPLLPGAAFFEAV